MNPSSQNKHAKLNVSLLLNYYVNNNTAKLVRLLITLKALLLYKLFETNK